MTWPTLELAQRQVARYEAQVADLTADTPPDVRAAAEKNLAHWRRRLAELLGGDAA